MSQLNLSNIHAKPELMDSLGTFFLLPDWWGRNWDAFSDCIGDWDISSLPSPTEIIGMEKLQENLRKDARILLEILDENDIQYVLLPYSDHK